MSKLVLKNLCKCYQSGVYAVKDFNMEIHDKEFIVLVGPSGCGKSTVLRMIAGLEEISGGELWVDGRRCNDVEPQYRDLAMVFQNYALYPHMTAYDNIAFSMKIKKVPKDEIDNRVKNAARMLGIESLLHRKPRELSGGQRQRVAIGGAIVRVPKAFLMDEPLSNLDAKLRNQMRVELARLHQSLQATIVYVTHDQVEAMTLGTRIVVMKDSLVQQIDTPANIYTHPQNLFVAGFIGSPEMNFFNVKLADDGASRGVLLGNAFMPVGVRFKKTLASGIFDKMVMGVRPEDLHVKTSNMHVPAGAMWEECPIPMKVLTREVLGSEVILHCQKDDVTVSVKCPPSNCSNPGDNISLMFDMNRVHLFDAHDSENILMKKAG